MHVTSIFDLFYALVLILILPSVLEKRIRSKNKYYLKYFRKGLNFKIFGVVCFCSTYVFYYGGGDTTSYFKGVKAVLSVLYDNPLNFLKLLTLEPGYELNKLFYFVNECPPFYMLKDPRTMAVIKISSLFSIIGLGGFFSTSILIAIFSYLWIWKLYVFFSERYPNKTAAINIAILFLPSSVFWASGIMKDTYAFCATCYMVVGLHQFFIAKERNLKTISQLILAFYLIITIKSYIMFALLPGLLIFANFERLKKIKSTLVKIIILPFSFGILIFAANTLFFDFNDMFGKYSADNLLEEAAIQNTDLQRSVYGPNSFNIGTFEPTLQGAGSMFFPAVNAALFRPYITETGSATMLLSGLENTLTLGLAIYVLLTQPFSFLKSIRKDSFLIFCLLFTLTLAFGVGLSTANFGALVRYKIPFLPFFIFLLLHSIKRLDKKVSSDNLSSKREGTNNQRNDDNFLINQSRKSL